MVTPRMVTDLPSGCVQLTMGPQPSYIDTEVTRAQVATDGHQSNGYQGLPQVVDPVYQHERRPLATLDRQFDPGTEICKPGGCKRHSE